MVDFELVPAHKTPPKNDKRDPVAKYFSKVLMQLLRSKVVRETRTGRTREANPTALAKALEQQLAGTKLRGTSHQTLRRLLQGEAIPRIDVVYELAKFFDVSPRVFLPEIADL